MMDSIQVKLVILLIKGIKSKKYEKTINEPFRGKNVD